MQTFNESGLNDDLLKAILEMGFETPTPIQSKTIPHLLQSDRDIIALAQTGTGKTAAFGLPLIQQIDLGLMHTQLIVLCPTRELCIQITKDFDSFSKYYSRLVIAATYGGASIEQQIKTLNKGAQIVVGTPGRVNDLIRRKKLKLENIKWLVLDEADEMLNMGFKEELDTILATTPDEKQTLLFSATMPNEIASIAKNYMENPMEIAVGKKNTGAENVEHYYYMVSARDRYLALKRIADINPKIYGIVFCRTRMETKEVADKLMQDGYNADALHGDLSQAQRDFVMKRFRNGNLNLLVATDVAARGLDVNNITHVINYNLPDDGEVYIHRSGRTGRAGKNGIAISILHSRENRKLREIEKKLGKTIERKYVPTGKEICEKQLFNLVDKVENVVIDESQIAQYIDPIYKKLSWLNHEELIKRFISVEFNRFLEYYKDADDINVSTNEKAKNRRKSVGFDKFYIGLGTKNGFSKRELIAMINKQSKLKSAEIGKIEIMKNFGFFELDNQYTNQLLKIMSKEKFKGKKFIVDLKSSTAKKKRQKHTKKRV